MLIKQSTKPEEKVQHMLALSNELFGRNIDQGIKMAKDAALVAQKNGDYVNLGFCYKAIGMGNYLKGMM